MIGSKIDKYTSQLTGRYISRHRRDWRTVKAVSPFVRHGMKYPESWLEFQYGVVPLLNDIKGVFDTLKHVDKDYDTFRVSVKAGVKNDSVTTVSSQDIQPQLGYIPWKCDLRSVTKSGAFVRLDYVMENPALAELQKLGLVNPALLAWNRLPYSFVVDWVFPVSDYLQAWTAALGYRFLGGSISTMRKVTASCSNASVVKGPFKSASVSISSNSLIGVDFKRYVLSSSPAPRMPHFKNPLSLRHTANAIALLTTALHRS